jgi:diaminopimelate decarboxylase
MAVTPDYQSLTRAAYVLHEEKLISNLKLINSVKEEAGISIILALKALLCGRCFHW